MPEAVLSPPAEKRARLEEILRGCESLVIGYSGGVDSVFLARIAMEVLGRERVLAVTGTSDSLASWMLQTAREVAERCDLPWLELRTEELADPRYAANPANRCYFCKTELWGRLRALAEDRGFRTVADGSNADDVGDHRPGALAAAERGVRSPLLEAGLTKAEIRAWSRELGLPTWDQPAAPCLASRIPYGTAVTPERLRQVENAEQALRALGLRDFRVRHHGEAARLEVHPSELPRVYSRPHRLAAAVRAAGFSRALLDLQGYRRGALNEGLAPAQLVRLGAGGGAGPGFAAPEPARRKQPPAAAASLPALAPEALGTEREVVVLALPAAVAARMDDAARDAVVSRLRALGHRFVALDLEAMG